MIVCYFGNYKQNYSRNTILINGLKQNGVRVLECHTREKGWRKYWELYRQHKNIKAKEQESKKARKQKDAEAGYDLMIVGFSGYSVMWFARLLTRKPIIFDAFVSLYLSDVEDRKKHSTHSFRAWVLSFLDKSSCLLADKVLLDTNAQIEYFMDRYNIPKEKFVRIPVGSDNKMFHPMSDVRGQMSNVFTVHWHGYIAPFDSVETIIKAVALLKNKHDISFQFITRFDKQYKQIKKLADTLQAHNITFHDQVDYSTLARMINQSDMCLGIFGNHKKAQLVIPNKIYEAVACGKPVITANHAVIKEVFTTNTITLVDPENPEHLANTIIKLKNNQELRDRLTQRMLQLYRVLLTPQVLGGMLKQVCESMVED